MACLTTGLLATGSAHAATTDSFSCTADAVTTQAGGGAVLDPITAGGPGACQPAVAGLGNSGEAVTLNKGTSARTAYATTSDGDTPTATAGVEGLGTDLGGRQLAVSNARSTMTASCAGERATYTPTSEVGSISLGGTPLVLDGRVQPVTDAVSNALGAVVEVRLNEVVDQPGGGKAVRAARITLVRGGEPVSQTIIAQSRVDASGSPCAAAASGDQAERGTPAGAVCPNGSVYVVPRNQCVIPAPGSTSQRNPLGDVNGSGAVVVGRPSGGQIGGRVIGLATARKRFPSSPCVRGKGLPYVILGTKHGDKITGTNHGDRVIGRGGRDRIDAGRGNDCVDAGKGRDFITGGQGHDRMYGGKQRDVVNGDGKSDRLHGGAGNDTLNTAYGADRAWGGPGNDKINVATAGRKATVYGGKGRDKVRCNPQEIHRIHGAEIVKVTRPLKLKKH